MDIRLRKESRPRHGASFSRWLLQFGHRLVRAGAIFLLGAYFLLSAERIDAASATWSSRALSSDWINPLNWSSPTIPDGGDDTATFVTSRRTCIDVWNSVTLNGVHFNCGADMFYISVGANPNVPMNVGVTLTISGAGIVNSASALETFTTGANTYGASGAIVFLNNASAGIFTTYTNAASAISGAYGGHVAFLNSATAARTTIINNGAVTTGADGGYTQFFNTSDAREATITNLGAATTDAGGGSLSFHDNSSAYHARITNSAGVFGASGGSGSGGTSFVDISSAGEAIIINNGSVDVNSYGGFTSFSANSNAGNATFENQCGNAEGFGGGETVFSDSATAANGTFLNKGGCMGAGGLTYFGGASTAGDGHFVVEGASPNGPARATVHFGGGPGIASAGKGTFVSQGATVGGGASGGFIDFNVYSTAEDAFITTGGGLTDGAAGATTQFARQSAAADATLLVNGAATNGAAGGFLLFNPGSTADHASIIANAGSNGGGGGVVRFRGDAVGGTASIAVYGNASLDLRFHSVPGLTVGSLEGDGNVLVGATTLSVGSNDKSTSFSGYIQDGRSNGSGSGGIAKIGTGVLTFEGRSENDYIADTLALTVVTGSPINLNFTGVPDRIRALIVDGATQAPGVYGGPDSDAPNQLGQFTGPGTVLVSETD
jgi:hypothetical protein